MRPLRLKRAYLHQEPLREEQNLRPLNRERASRYGAGVDHEAELQERQDEHDEEPAEYLLEQEMLVDRGVLAFLDVLVLALLVRLVLHWARRKTRGQHQR